MKLHTLRLSNFQSFGTAPTEIKLDEISYLIGPNGSGKTAALQALCRLFAFDPSLRRILRSDFHVPFNEAAAPSERQLWIEADFLFPELGDDDENSTVAPHFGHMRLDEIGSVPRVRFRLTATMGQDGDIDECFEYVTDLNADGTPLERQRYLGRIGITFTSTTCPHVEIPLITLPIALMHCWDACYVR